MLPVLNEKRWVTIASSLKNAILAGELPVGARIASEVEMAAQWNVSPMTVHRALTELQRDGWVIRRRRAGTVVADRSAQPLTKIALVCTNYTDLPQAAYFDGIESGLGAGQYLLPLSTSNNPLEEARCLERALAECAAIICYPTGASENKALLQQAAATLPLLFIDCTVDGVDADAVMTDNLGSMQLGLRHLQQLGHTRIGYFMQQPQPVSSARDRYNGYLEFQKNELGVADPQRWMRSFAADLSWSDYYLAIEAALVELLQQPEPITALACQQDTQLILVQEACVRLGIALPEELAVLSFSNTAFGQPFLRNVHRLVQRAPELGTLAAKRIQQRLATPDLAPQPLRLMTDLYTAQPYIPSATALEFRAKR